MNPHDATEQAYRNGYAAGYNAAKDEIVRCEVCRWAEEYKRMDNRTGYYCLFRENSFEYGTNGERTFHPIKEPDNFCSYGERKEDAK